MVGRPTAVSVADREVEASWRAMWRYAGLTARAGDVTLIVAKVAVDRVVKALPFLQSGHTI